MPKPEGAEKGAVLFACFNTSLQLWPSSVAEPSHTHLLRLRVGELARQVKSQDPEQLLVPDFFHLKPVSLLLIITSHL